MEQTLKHAESVGHLFVKPAVYQSGQQILVDQREAISIVRLIRTFYDGIEQRAEAAIEKAA